jgi:valyl-tRNA synthetase
MNGVGASHSIAAPEAELPVNRWIIGEVVETLAKLDKAFAELRFDEMADAIYHFTWGTFCDWYVELVKGAFDDETKAVAAWAFDQILVMLHPFMPFITEELWHAMGERPYDLIVAKWPSRRRRARDRLADRAGQRNSAPRDRAQRAVGAKLVPFTSIELDPDASSGSTQCAHPFAHARSIVAFDPDDRVPGRRGADRRRRGDLRLPLEGVIDLDAERPACPRPPKPPRRSATQPRRAPRQSELHRARQARGGREGARRP